MTYFERPETVERQSGERWTDAWRREMKIERHFEPMTIEEREERFAEVYQEVYNTLERWIGHDELIAMTEDDKRGSAETITENRLVKDFVIPPRWNGVVECERCGPMPYRFDLQGAKACPWCISDEIGE